MIPSWKVQAGSGASSDTLLNPIIFYRIKVGIQSPEGVSSSHDTLRRFSDFLKLFSALKRLFSKKDIPPAPPKHTLLRINSSRLLLEERRRALEEWIGKVLSDIDLSRSAPVATFLELEAAARSSFQDANDLTSGASNSGDAPSLLASNLTRSSSSVVLAKYSTIDTKSLSVASNVANDIAFDNSDAGDLSNGIMGVASTLDQPEDFLTDSLPQSKDSTSSGGDSSYRNSSKQSFLLRDRVDFSSDQDHDKLSYHSRKLSIDSIGSDASSVRASELSESGFTSSIWEVSNNLSGGVALPMTMDALSTRDTHLASDAQILLPTDQHHNLNRVLLSMQRRLATARTDMEDVISRLNQEITVKEYLTSKVQDLEVELEVTKQRNKENLQQAIVLERERFTQTQWDMDDLHRKYLELESKLKFEQSEKIRIDSENTSASSEKEILHQELSAKQEQIVKLERDFEHLEKKSKADIKVLVKEVKFLRNSQAELKEMLNHSTKEKAELERELQNKSQRWAFAKARKKKLLYECEILYHQLKESSVNFLNAEGDRFTVDPSSLPDALGLLTTSDNRIGLLIAEAQLLAQEDEEDNFDPAKVKTAGSPEDVIAVNGDDPATGDEGLRRMLINSLLDNAKLRKQANSISRCALKAYIELGKGDGDEASSRKTILNRFLQR